MIEAVTEFTKDHGDWHKVYNIIIDTNDNNS